MAKVTFRDYGQVGQAWFGDFGNREHLVAGGGQLDTTANFAAEGDVTVHNTAVANVGATSIAVTALTGAIPSGTALDFGGVVAVLSAPAAAGATSLSVQPLGEQIPDESDAVYDSLAGTEVVRAGTIVGRTWTESDAGAPFGPAADTDDEIYLTVADVDLAQGNEVSLVRHGSRIKINFLPTWAGASSALKTKLRAAYETTHGN